MADVLFVVKTFLATFLLVVLMQIQIDGRTIESRTQDWIRESAIVSTLRGVAHGGAKMLHNGYQSSLSFLSKHIKPEVKQEQIAGSGGFRFNWEKDDRILAEQEQNRERIRQLEDVADDYQNEESSNVEDSSL